MEEINYWPELKFSDWHKTNQTLHMFTQVIGKIKLELTPKQNHWWNICFYVSPFGLTTGAMPYNNYDLLNIEFDFINHQLNFISSKREVSNFKLNGISVSEFYELVFRKLAELNVKVKIWDRPVEVLESISFKEDKIHKTYDINNVKNFHQVMINSSTIFNEFRSDFYGKCSPVHFFWGAFDLAVTRFSGNTAPKHQGGIPNVGDFVMHEAYSHQLSSAGFWPGNENIDALFYSYSYPEPEGFREAKIYPDYAYFNNDLGEFVLPYSKLREEKSPRDELLKFLNTTYEAAANLGKWNRKLLENKA